MCDIPEQLLRIILTSETLDPVPDPGKAWQEISLTLDDRGYEISIVPVLPSQPTAGRI